MKPSVENWILETEGGYVNDPDDPGGETKFGISKRSYPELDIANLTPEQALAIYDRDFWRPAGCEQIAEIDPALALAVFDFAVHSGVRRALRVLQAQLGLSTTGVFSDELARTIRTDRRAPRHLLHSYLLYRVFFLARLASAPKYLHGWVNRIKKLLLVAEALR